MDYSANVQNSITFIEQHLCDELTLDEIAKAAGFSRYHFLRIFKKELGVGIRDFILTRRMIKAAELLLTTGINVMDIAVLLQFDSQEAFTHAFKREYSLPPGQYRRAMMNVINTRKETSVVMYNQVIPGWIITGNMPKLYSVAPDNENNYNGANSIMIKNKSEILETGAFCTVLQQFKARNYIGKRVRFSGYVKSQEVKEWGGLWMRINSTTANILRIDNMQNRPIKGDTDWTKYSVVLDIPENSSIINIGVLLNGSGRMWLAGVVFEEVDKSVNTTDVDLSCDLPEAPVNLSFNGN